MNLNNKQQRFVEEYLIDMNASKSAIRAGYSEKTAYSIGNELLKKPEIQEYIKIKQEELSNRCLITKEELIRDLIYIKELSKDNQRSGNALKAIELINKMLGFNAPTETNINLNTEQPLFSDSEDE